MIRANDIVVIYPGPIGQPEKNHLALNSISFSIKKGEIIAIMGPSGSGKTTLLDVINGTLEPNAGLLFIDNHSIYSMPSVSRKRYLSSTIPSYMIHQQMAHNLIYNLSAEENVLLELAASNKLDYSVVSGIFNDLKISDLRKIPVSRLSGGERQLICFAKALLQKSQILLLDEPTSALDDKNKHIVMEKIIEVCKTYQITTIFASHDTDIIKYADRVISIYDGLINRLVIQNTDSANDSVKVSFSGDHFEVSVDDDGVVYFPQYLLAKLNSKERYWIYYDYDQGKLIINSENFAGKSKKGK